MKVKDRALITASSFRVRCVVRLHAVDLMATRKQNPKTKNNKKSEERKRIEEERVENNSSS